MVESVGFRAARIRELDGSILTISKPDPTAAHVINFGARRFRRFRTQVIVPFGIPAGLSSEFQSRNLKGIFHHPGGRQENIEVALDDPGNSGVEDLVQLFFDVSDGYGCSPPAMA